MMLPQLQKDDAPGSKQAGRAERARAAQTRPTPNAWCVSHAC